ncbi:MAG: DUF131 domain-containing protein [Thermoplasmatales archaeon]
MSISRLNRMRGMSRLYVLPAISIVLFIASEVVLLFLGLVKIYYFFFIPVFVSSSALSLIPLIFFLIPIVVLFISLKTNDAKGKSEHFDFSPYEKEYYSSPKDAKTSSGYGGVIMIGPIPIVFGKGISERGLIALVILAVLIIVIWLLLAR